LEGTYLVCHIGSPIKILSVLLRSTPCFNRLDGQLRLSMTRAKILGRGLYNPKFGQKINKNFNIFLSYKLNTSSLKQKKVNLKSFIKFPMD
jgi:hypothetical protein